MNTLKQMIKNHKFAFTLVAVLLLLFVSLHGQWSQSYATDKSGASQEDTQTKQDETNKNKYYSVTDELVCGNVRVEAVSTCAEEADFPNGPCINQKIFFIGKDDNKKLVKDLIDNEILSDMANSWGCVKDKKNKKYIAIGYGTGGNCTFCEWSEIYDLEGELLISNYFYGSEIYCAAGYYNYLTGWRDYAYFKDSCEGLSKSVVNEIKKEARKNLEDSKKIVKLTGKDGKFLEEMKYREITRKKYYQKNKN
ncbi:MAG: hypothetical protein AABX39_05045 [Nanoarchaeota archaeon]